MNLKNVSYALHFAVISLFGALTERLAALAHGIGKGSGILWIFAALSFLASVAFFLAFVARFVASSEEELSRSN